MTIHAGMPIAREGGLNGAFGNTAADRNRARARVSFHFRSEAVLKAPPAAAG